MRHLTTLSSLGALLLGLFSFNASAVELTGTTNAHDPSAIVKDENTYFYFTTGVGIWYNTSTNLTHWGNSTTVFTPGNYPDWIAEVVPENNGSDFWAPDVIEMGDYYYVYYSVSTFGSHQSAIGVVRTPSLVNPQWEDLGPVVISSDEENYRTEINAIDPALFEDNDGRVYMTYGSFFGGIGLVEIDPETGLLLDPEQEPQQIFAGNHQPIEAPYLIREGDYYYLYYNFGSCCQGLESTYEIRVAWSENIEGPYTDDYTILENDAGDRYVGPGHVGLFEEDGCQYISTHYYDRNSDGFARVDLLALGYDSSDMPFFTRDFTPGQCEGLSADDEVTDPEEPSAPEEPSDPEEPSAPEEPEGPTTGPDDSTASDGGSSSGGAASGLWLVLLTAIALVRRRRV